MDGNFLRTEDGQLVLIDSYHREKLKGHILRYGDNHIRIEDGTSAADFLTGRKGTGYRNYCAHDLRADNLTHSHDPMLRDMIRVHRQPNGHNELRVAIDVADDCFPTAGILLLSILERAIQRAIATYDGPEPFELTMQEYREKQSELI